MAPTARRSARWPRAARPCWSRRIAEPPVSSLSSRRGRLGMDVIVLDHHQAPEVLPDAIVVNPNRQDDVSGQGALCAAGVAFVALVALNRALRQRGFWRERLEPDLLAVARSRRARDGCRRRAADRPQSRLRRQGPVADEVARPRRPARAGRRRRPERTAARLSSRLSAWARASTRAAASATRRWAPNCMLLRDEHRGRRHRRRSWTGSMASARSSKSRCFRRLWARPTSRLGPAEEGAFVLAAGDGLAAGHRWPRRLAAEGVVWPSGLRYRLRRRDRNGLGALDRGRRSRARWCARRSSSASSSRAAATPWRPASPCGATNLRRSSPFSKKRLAEPVARARANAGLAVDGLLTASACTPALVEEIEKAGPFGAGNPEPVFVLPRTQDHRCPALRRRPSAASGPGGRRRAAGAGGLPRCTVAHRRSARQGARRAGASRLFALARSLGRHARKSARGWSTWLFASRGRTLNKNPWRQGDERLASMNWRVYTSPHFASGQRRFALRAHRLAV